MTVYDCPVFCGFILVIHFLFQDLQLKSIPICVTVTLTSKFKYVICKQQIWSVIHLQKLCYHAFAKKKKILIEYICNLFLFICRLHFRFRCNFVLHYAVLFPRQTDQFLNPLCYIYQVKHPLLDLEITLKFNLLEFSIINAYFGFTSHPFKHRINKSLVFHCVFCNKTRVITWCFIIFAYIHALNHIN